MHLIGHTFNIAFNTFLFKKFYFSRYVSYFLYWTLYTGHDTRTRCFLFRFLNNRRIPLPEIDNPPKADVSSSGD